MSILLNDDRCTDLGMLDFARDLLVWFVKVSKDVFGNFFNVYNVHALTHIVDDVLHHGSSLNHISAFKFENYMQTIKKMVRNSHNPIAQIVKRISEKMEHESLPKTFGLKNNFKDAFFIDGNGNVCEIVQEMEEVYECRVVKSRFLKSFFEFAIPSIDIGIFVIDNNQIRSQSFISKRNSYTNLIVLPYKNSLVCFPLLHSL